MRENECIVEDTACKIKRGWMKWREATGVTYYKNVLLSKIER